MSEEFIQFDRLAARGMATADELMSAGDGMQADGRLDQNLGCWRLARHLFPELSVRDVSFHTSMHLDSRIYGLVANIREIGRWLHPVPLDAPPLYRAAVAAASAGNLAGAAERFRACVAEGILTGQSWFGLAVTCLFRSDAPGVVEATTQAINADFRTYKVAHLLGRLSMLLLNIGVDRIEEARNYYQIALDADPDDEQFLFEYGDFLWQRCGDYEAARPVLARAVALRDARIAAHPLGRYGIVSVGHYTYAIGSMSHDFEYLAKALELGWIKDWKPQIAVRHGRMANIEMIRYFKRYLTVVEDQELCDDLSEAYEEVDVNPALLQVPGLGFRWSGDLHSCIEKEWEAQCRPPILSIEETDQVRGRAILREQFGIPEDAWYVSFYLRYAGYKGDSDFDRYRHAQLRNYIPAMRRVVERGGWAIWFGDRRDDVPELGDRVIPYATSSVKGEFMDLFLWATSHFFVGGHGGGSFPPRTFGVPVLFCDFSPLQGPSWKPGDRLMPKRAWSSREERFLTLSDTRRPPFFYLLDGRRVASFGLEMQDCDPEAIVEAVDEMFDQGERDPALDAMRAYCETLETTLGGVRTPPLAYPFLRRYGPDYVR